MNDLSLNPEATNVSPGEARRIAEINRLRPTPKPSTTSFASTGDSSMQTPIRTASVEERRQTIAAMTPTADRVQAGWDRFEANNAARSAAYEKEKADEQAALRQADERRLAEINAQIARKKARQLFDAAESTIDLALSELTPAQRGRVMTRLIAANKIHDTDLAMGYALEEKYSSAPVADAPQVDWRGGVVKKK